MIFRKVYITQTEKQANISLPVQYGTPWEADLLGLTG